MIDYIKKNIETMGDNWALCTIPCSYLDETIIKGLEIQSILSQEENRKVSMEEIFDDDNEIGIHIYWDEIHHPNSVEIGLYAFGGGDTNLNKTLKDILTDEQYLEIFKYGYLQIQKYK